MRCQEGEGEEDDPPLVPRLGTRTGSTLLFSTTTRFCDMKQKRNYSFLTSRSIAKTSYTIRSSGVLLQTGRVFLMIFIVGVKSYMEVSNETSDIQVGVGGWVWTGECGGREVQMTTCNVCGSHLNFWLTSVGWARATSLAGTNESHILVFWGCECGEGWLTYTQNLLHVQL